MTTSPPALISARTLILAHLPINPLSVGIVGDASHRGGYHCGSDRVVAGDYSVHESPRDRAGLSGYASALDIGAFGVKSGGQTHNLRSLSIWLVAQCRAGADDTRDIREIIYSPDGKTVARWDRLGKRATGDDSHLYHTHISYFRDAAHSDLSAVYRRWLAEIGLTGSAPSTPSPTWTETIVTNLPTLKRSATGADVRRSMGLLAANGCPPANSLTRAGTYDGIAGAGWEAAARKFQATQKIAVDGVIGKATWTKLLGR